MSISLFLMVAGFVLLLLAGLGVGDGGRFKLGWFGLAAWLLATLLAGVAIS